MNINQNNYVYFKKYLEKINFRNYLKKLSKKLNNRPVIIYGTGEFFSVIESEYDLSCLNIIALSDNKYLKHNYTNEFSKYKKIPPNEIVQNKPYAVLVSVVNPVRLVNHLKNNDVKNSNIKVDILYNKSKLELIKEIIYTV